MVKDVLILVFLVLINGFFSCAELAVLSVNPNKIKLKADNGDKKAKLIKHTLDNPDRFMSTIQIAISLVGLFTGAYAGQTFAEPVVKFLVSRGVTIPVATLRNAVVLLITVFMSYFTLVFGELVPKKLALQRSEKISFMVISPVSILSKICSPFVKILSLSTNVIVKIMHLENKQDDDKYTEEEIRMLVDAGSEIGSIDEDEMEMINNIFEFDDKTAEDICTHRTDIVAIDIDSAYEEVVPLLTEMKYSRLPVYEESIDNIIGILHIKDFMRYLLENKLNIDDAENIDLKGIARDAYFVPTSKRSDELFAEMQKDKIHLSIVVDE
ncbi:hemolysin family protein, partial [Tyzzerella sp. OttesenSCG-928-J15]|nr:hemolysin family protein [Tyzzerella sp. OttesenSCG-928-J15]